MTKFKFHFTGRKINAIGITYPIVAIREGNSQEDAQSKLYEEFECIHVYTVQIE